MANLFPVTSGICAFGWTTREKYRLDGVPDAETALTVTFVTDAPKSNGTVPLIVLFTESSVTQVVGGAVTMLTVSEGSARYWFSSIENASPAVITTT